MEALCPGENRSRSKPQNFYKGLHLFHVLREWINLHFINHSFWDNMGLIQPDDPQNLMAVPGSSIVYLFTAHPLPCGCSSKACRVSYSRDNLCLLTLYHQCNGPISLMWGRSIESDFRPAFCDILWSWQVALKKHWKGSLLSFPHEGKMILGYQKPYQCLFYKCLEDEVLMQEPFLPKHESKTITANGMAVVKIWWEFIITQLTRELL